MPSDSEMAAMRNRKLSAPDAAASEAMTEMPTTDVDCETTSAV